MRIQMEMKSSTSKKDQMKPGEEEEKEERGLGEESEDW